MKLLFKNVTLVDPENLTLKNSDVLIENGKILRVEKGISAKAKKIEGKDCFILPGLFDMHVHLREPGREDEEDIESGSKAAISGGFTSVACMPNTDPPLDNPPAIEWVRRRAREVGLIDIFPVGAISKGLKGETLTEMGRLLKAGAVAFSDDGRGVQNARLMRLAMDYARGFDALLILHEEDEALSGGGQVHEGFYSTILGLKGIPSLAETVMLTRDILLAQLTGCRVHFTHLSTRESVEIIRRAKEEGLKISCDVTPHHLLLSHDSLLNYDTNLKVKPPLRTRDDMEALREGVAEGVIDVIASDHAPHAREEKEVEFEKASFGIVGLETTLPLLFTELVEKKIVAFPELIRKLSLNPLRILKLPFKNVIPGEDANLVFFDPTERSKIEPSLFQSKSTNTPFKGWKVSGKVKWVFSHGKLVFEEGVFLSE
jgi:dihydroorotase